MQQSVTAVTLCLALPCRAFACRGSRQGDSERGCRPSPTDFPRPQCHKYHTGFLSSPYLLTDDRGAQDVICQAHVCLRQHVVDISGRPQRPRPGMQRINKHVRSQSERGLLCVTAMPFARAMGVIMVLRLQLDDTHSNTIAIDSKVVSGCVRNGLSKQAGLQACHWQKFLRACKLKPGFAC